MKKLAFALVFVGIFLVSTCAMAFVIGVSGKYDYGADMYGFGSGSKATWGPAAAYPSIHLVLGGDKDTLLDIGVGMGEEGRTPVSIGAVYTYFDLIDVLRFYGSAGITYYFVPNNQGFTNLKLNSTMLGLDISLPFLPFSIFAGAGMRSPMTFGPGDYIDVALGWNIEAGATFYLVK